MPLVGVSFSEHSRPNIYGVRSLITSSNARYLEYTGSPPASRTISHTGKGKL